MYTMSNSKTHVFVRLNADNYLLHLSCCSNFSVLHRVNCVARFMVRSFYLAFVRCNSIIKFKSLTIATQINSLLTFIVKISKLICRINLKRIKYDLENWLYVLVLLWKLSIQNFDSKQLFTIELARIDFS